MWTDEVNTELLLLLLIKSVGMSFLSASEEEMMLAKLKIWGKDFVEAVVNKSISDYSTENSHISSNTSTLSISKSGTLTRVKWIAVALRRVSIYPNYMPS